MKERPILFSGPMVRALINGTKTQTRRVVKNVPEFAGDEANSAAGHAGEYFEKLPCPYGVPGDRLWVKETFCCDNTEYLAQYKDAPWLGLPDASNAETYYRASEANPDIFPRWKPSIFMPRWASRITLEVNAVRVERLNDISEEDAKAEGIECNFVVSNGRKEPPVWRDYAQAQRDPFEWYSAPSSSYRSLWESINGPGSWALNPWVWVIEFRKL